MTTVSITFYNYDDEPRYLQVAPWAGVYLLKKGEHIKIIAESETSSPSFSVGESDTTRIMEIEEGGPGDGYYVVIDGQRFHSMDYPTDSRLNQYCLGSLKLEHASLRVCQCGKGTP